MSRANPVFLQLDTARVSEFLRVGGHGELGFDLEVGIQY